MIDPRVIPGLAWVEEQSTCMQWLTHLPTNSKLMGVCEIAITQCRFNLLEYEYEKVLRSNLTLEKLEYAQRKREEDESRPSRQDP